MEQPVIATQKLWPQDYEQASYAYLMAIAGVIVGMPLPIVNMVAGLLFYAGKRKASYFVRWHCIQAILAQVVLLPFNSIAVGWTIRIIYNTVVTSGFLHDTYSTIGTDDIFTSSGTGYWQYIAFVIALNIAEFITVITTASAVGKGKNVRLFLIAPVADYLCSKQNRETYPQ